MTIGSVLTINSRVILIAYENGTKWLANWKKPGCMTTGNVPLEEVKFKIKYKITKNFPGSGNEKKKIIDKTIIENIMDKYQPNKKKLIWLVVWKPKAVKPIKRIVACKKDKMHEFNKIIEKFFNRNFHAV